MVDWGKCYIWKTKKITFAKYDVQTMTFPDPSIPVGIFESINTIEWTRWIHIQLNQTASTSYDMIHIWSYIYPQTQVSLGHQRIA